jgi:hypothetical protein
MPTSKRIGRNFGVEWGWNAFRAALWSLLAGDYFRANRVAHWTGTQLTGCQISDGGCSAGSLSDWLSAVGRTSCFTSGCAVAAGRMHLRAASRQCPAPGQRKIVAVLQNIW